MNQMPRIFLTGGTGFFGRALLRHWIEQYSHGLAALDVTILTRLPDTFLVRYPEFRGVPWLKFHAGDILNPDSLPKGQFFTHVLHAATDSTLGPQLSPHQHYSQIVNGTKNILDYAVACGAKRFLLTSSGGVYGPQPPGMKKVPEAYNGMPDPLIPANAYGVAKRMAEHLCVLYQDMQGIEPIIARCFSFVGQDLPLNVHFAIGNFIRDALWGKEIVVNGNGAPVRSYLDQRDLAAWLLALLANGSAGQAYNVGSDREITVAELAHLVRDLVSPGKGVRVLGGDTSHNYKNRYVPDIEKSRNELGLREEFSLEEAIAHTASVAARCGRQE